MAKLEPQILDISQGGLIDVPPGVWTVPPYDKLWPAKKLVIRGCGYGLCELRLSQPLQLVGMKQWGIADVTITGHGVHLDEGSNLGVMQNVMIADCQWCMRLSCCWDSHFYNCQFVRAKEPMVFVAGAKGSNVNNHNFIGCRWEMCDDLMLVLETWAIKNRFIAPKWHGKLPAPVVVDHVHLKGAFDNMFVGGNMTNGGRSGFVFSEDARDNSFGGMHVNGCRMWGFEGQVKLNDLTGVVFPTGRNGRNGRPGQGGNVQPQ